MTDSNATLLPCPFCGGEASKRLFYKGKYRVHCNVCDAHSGDVCDTEAEAIEAWNTRTPEQAVAATLGTEQPCFATQANYEHCKYSTNRGWCDDSRYAELFGTPERAANILALGCMGADENVCDSCVFRECDGKLRRCGSIHSIATQMLEWLRGKAVKR